MGYPPPFRLTHRRRDGTVFKWFYGKHAEADARQERDERKGSELHRRNRETGEWETVEDV